MSANRPFTSIPLHPRQDYPAASRECRDNKLQSSATIADSLVAFYQQEQIWIYRRRANLVNNYKSPPPVDREARDIIHPRYDRRAGRSQHPQSSRWMRRKQDFKLRINDISSKYVDIQQKDQGSTSKSALSPEKILDMLDKLVETRLESCERVSKLTRQANLANA